MVGEGKPVGARSPQNGNTKCRKELRHFQITDDRDANRKALLPIEGYAAGCRVEVGAVDKVK